MQIMGYLPVSPTSERQRTERTPPEGKSFNHPCDSEVDEEYTSRLNNSLCDEFREAAEEI